MGINLFPLWFFLLMTIFFVIWGLLVSYFSNVFLDFLRNSRAFSSIFLECRHICIWYEFLHYSRVVSSHVFLECRNIWIWAPWKEGLWIFLMNLIIKKGGFWSRYEYPMNFWHFENFDLFSNTREFMGYPRCLSKGICYRTT